MEKQKVKHTYGVLERQFSNVFKKAVRAQGSTGENLMKFLETRLDNVVYRMGIAPTRRAARQLVSHKHITVNGEIVNIASYSLRPGDLVGVREKSKSLQIITDALSGRANARYSWLEWDNTEMQGRFMMLPEREEIPENVQERLIVELYSK